MSDIIHPVAPHHLPGFIPGPDGSDPLFTGVIIGLLVMLMVVGVMYFKLHALPEHLGEKHNSAQLQLISVLAVLALFTHNNVFWVLALLIAVIRLPDFLSPLQGIAKSLAIIASQKNTEGTTATLPVSNAGGEVGESPAEIKSTKSDQASQAGNGEGK